MLTRALSRYRVGSGEDGASPGGTDGDDAHAREHRGGARALDADGRSAAEPDAQAHVSGQRVRAAGGRSRRSATGRGAGERGESVAVTSTRQPRSQLSVSASPRRAKMPVRRGRLTRSTGATSSGGGHAPAGRQPTPGGGGRVEALDAVVVRVGHEHAAFAAHGDAPSAERGSPSPTPRSPHLAR